jgi:polyhydroxybutyrate depolymerase
MNRSVLIFLVIGVIIIFFSCPDDDVLALEVTPELGQTQNGSFDFEGHQRNYVVYLPNNYTDTIDLPMVIYLHSYGWTAMQGMRYTLLHQVADTSNFIVVYPSAINNWNSGIGDNPDWPTSDVNDVGFINAMIDTLNNHYSIDLERIYACGFSNGGFMSYKLACQLSHRIAAIASVSGVMSSGTAVNCNSLHKIPVLHIHGTADNLVGNEVSGWYSVDQTLSYWTDFNDCVQVDTVLLPDLDKTDGCRVTKISYSSCSDESNVIFYKVINGGHSWPSATADYSWAGAKTNDINASVEIWNFFKKF